MSSNWLSSFISQPSSKFFVVVDKDYLLNVSKQYLNDIPYGEFAIKRILNHQTNNEHIPNEGLMESAAEMLYGMIHKEFIQTQPGLQLMRKKFILKEFGTCPRVYCRKLPLLPIGLHDKPGIENVKLFCCNCLDVYRCHGVMESTDGAFFGHGYLKVFLEQYEPDILSLVSVDKDSSSSDSFITSDNSSLSIRSISDNLNDQVMYVPRIFGFRVNEKADHGPKNAWLRTRANCDHRTGRTL